MDKTLLLEESLLHERVKLLANNLLINLNEPINIDKSLVGMWISIAWERKSDDLNDDRSFFTFDAGLILSFKDNSFQVFYKEGGKIYIVKLQRNNWFKCLETPPTRPYQWQLLSKKVSFASSNFFTLFLLADITFVFYCFFE